MILHTLLSRELCRFCGLPLRGELPFCPDCEAQFAAEAFPGSRCPRCSFPLFPEEGECAFCGMVPPEIDALHALFPFAGVHKELLHLYKSGELPGLRFFYAARLEAFFRTQPEGLIVPVPPRKGKIRRRGWDQVDLLCRTLERRCGRRVLRALKRTDGLQQKSLGREERLRHMARGILLREKAVPRLRQAGRLFLLDDVFTTGATMGACAAALKRAHPRPVTGVALCSVL